MRRYWAFYLDSPLIVGTIEGQDPGMEIQILFCLSIEAITPNRSSETIGVCGVNPELVRTSRQRLEKYQGSAFDVTKDSILGMRRFAVLMHLLSPSLTPYTPEGQCDLALSLTDQSIQPGQILFLSRLSDKLRL